MVPRPVVVCCTSRSSHPLINWLSSLNMDGSALDHHDKLNAKLSEVFSDDALDSLLGDLQNYLGENSGSRRQQAAGEPEGRRSIRRHRAASTQWSAHCTENGDSLVWHLPNDAWVQPEDVEMNLDVPNRQLELRARKEVSATTRNSLCQQNGGKKQEHVAARPTEEANPDAEKTSAESQPPSSDLRVVRELRQCLTIPDDVDIDQLQATLSADRSEFVVVAPLKVKRQVNKSDASAPVPIKITRK